MFAGTPRTREIVACGCGGASVCSVVSRRASGTGTVGPTGPTGPAGGAMGIFGTAVIVGGGGFGSSVVGGGLMTFNDDEQTFVVPVTGVYILMGNLIVEGQGTTWNFNINAAPSVATFGFDGPFDPAPDQTVSSGSITVVVPAGTNIGILTTDTLLDGSSFSVAFVGSATLS